MRAWTRACVAGVQIAITSLANDLAEGEDHADAARSTVAELSSTRQMVAIYDGGGRLLAEGGRDSDLELTLPAALGDSGERRAVSERVRNR